MPHARDRMDVVVVPAAPELELDRDAVVDLFDRWQDRALLASGGSELHRSAGPRAEELLPGGFGSLRLDRPAGITLYANQLGGFRVQCPACQAPLALAFGQAVQSWRAGGDPTVRCAHCGQARPAAQVPLRPPGAFARGAVIFGDVQGLQPAGPTLEALRQVLGEVKVVLRRRS